MMENREIKFEYGFEADNSNSIIKKVYDIEKIQQIETWCDVWFDLPLIYRRQFTGLKDKNGVEIYEGDILPDEEGLLTVVWNKECACWGMAYEQGNYADHINIWETNKMEVIGNIYQNPELL